MEQSYTWRVNDEDNGLAGIIHDATIADVKEYAENKYGSTYMTRRWVFDGQGHLLFQEMDSYDEFRTKAIAIPNRELPVDDLSDRAKAIAVVRQMVLSEADGALKDFTLTMLDLLLGKLE